MKKALGLSPSSLLTSKKNDLSERKTLLLRRLANFTIDAICDCEYKLGRTEVDDHVKEMYSPSPDGRLRDSLSVHDLKSLTQPETSSQK